MILVVIDMQPAYKEACNRSLQARIRQTVRDHDGPVCIVEYEGSGKTFPGIVKAAKGKHLVRCVKSRDDGGDVVVGACEAEGLGAHKHFILVGVNTAYCVIGTACGILHARKDTKVTLLIKGCRNPDDGIHREPTFAAAHVWRNEDDYQPNGKRGRRFLQFNKRPRRK